MARDGIYYLRAGADSSIRYRDLGSGADIEILSGTRMVYPGVSPDEETVFFSTEQPAQSELWLVENFR